MRGRIHYGFDGKARHVGGCRRPVATKVSHPHLFRGVEDFLPKTPVLPTPPPSLDYYSVCMPALSNIDGNGTYGDCVCAWIIHMVCAITAAAGNPVVLGEADALALYTAVTGFNPSDPSTDQGTDPIAALQYVQQNGIDGKGTHKIAGWLTVDASNPVLIRQMLDLFGPALMMWLCLPDSYMHAAASGPGFTWQKDTPDANNGHCIGSVGYVPGKLVIDTWGDMPGYIEDDAVASECTDVAGGGLVIVLTKEILSAATQKSPTGLDWTGILQVFDGLGGSVAA